MCGLITTMTTQIKQYDTLSAFYADLLAWEQTKALYESLNYDVPDKPVWNPSPNYVEYD